MHVIRAVSRSIIREIRNVRAAQLQLQCPAKNNGRIPARGDKITQLFDDIQRRLAL